MIKASVGERAYRDYAGMVSRLKPGPDREMTMRLAVDAMWDTLGSRGVSWIGFYLKVSGKDEMVLGPRRDKPACSPIGLHGMCGHCWQEKKPIIVRDVATLGSNYIACDPKDKSELVIPLFEPDGSCWGVLDADSYDVDSFQEFDVGGLTRAVERAGLSTPQRPAPVLLRM
jgi:putative methionine-R-sulfoxide reductase with GAF domain